MINLLHHIPALAECHTVVMAAGGWSLHKYRSKITGRLERDSRTALFDVNQHYSDNSLDELAKLPNIKVAFAMDFHIVGDGGEIERFCSLPNSWFVCRLGTWKNKLDKKYWRQVIFAPSVFDARLYEHRQGTLYGAGGTLSYAYSAIPPSIDTVDIYSADAICTGSKKSYSGNDTNGGYLYYAEFNREGLGLLSEQMNITLCV